MAALCVRSLPFLRVACLGFIAAAILGGCATADPSPLARHAPCAPAGRIAYQDDGKLLTCAETAEGRTVWQLAGIDQPITAKGAKDTPCEHVGDLAVAADGSVLHCSWNKADLTPTNGAVNGN